MEDNKAVSEEEVQVAVDKQRAIMAALSEAYEDQLQRDMGLLHNQFVSFISAAKIPLPHALLVLQMLITETIEQAKRQYLGE